jgi:hypothetical protein
LALYCSSVEKPCGVIVTSGCEDPPQPRNSVSPQVVSVEGRGWYMPRSSVWRRLPDSGWSQQYLTRTDVVPAGTSNGTIT